MTAPPTLQPQRRRKGAWQPCQPHQAERWAIVSPNGGAPLFISKSKHEALLQLARTGRSFIMNVPKLQPGARYPQLGTAAHSLLTSGGAPIAQGGPRYHGEQA